MERNVTMAEISDGKLYSRDDMVKAGCDDCRGVRRAATEWVIRSCWIHMMCTV